MLLNIKRTFRPDYILHAATGVFLILALSGCNTRIEGCLDVNAENFDLNAERPCDGCCTYPSIGLSLTQKWGNRNFANTDTLYDIHTRPYIIKDLKYFFSTWIWVDDEGTLYTPDSIDALCDSEIFTYTPDNIILDTRQFNYTLGTIRRSPHIDSVFFTFGLSSDFSCLDTEDPKTPPALTEQSPLWNAKTSRLETLRLVVQLDLEAEQFDTLFLSDQIGMGLIYQDQFDKGFDKQFQLTVDYALWFQDADTSDPLSFGTSISAHFTGSLSRTP